MKPQSIVKQLKRALVIGSAVAVSMVSTTVFAQLSVNVDIGVPPPPPRVEVVPAAPAGYVWAPGYWEWFHDHHIWRRGHFVAARPGYVWAPDRWEARGENHHFNPGHWEQDRDYHHGPHHR